MTEPNDARQAIRRARAAARAAAPGRVVQLRVAINAAGAQSANTYLWRRWSDAEDQDVEIIEYLATTDLDASLAHLVQPDDEGRLGLDLEVFTRKGGWEADKCVYVRADGALFRDEGMTSPLAEHVPPNYRKIAIKRFGEETVDGFEQVVRHTVQALLAHPSLGQAGIELPAGAKPHLSLSWSPKRVLSRGGSKGLNMAMRQAWIQSQRGHFREYRSFDKDPVIGRIATKHPREYFEVLTAHELAHWMQDVARRPGHFGDYRVPHGRCFQAVYRVLRLALLDLRQGPAAPTIQAQLASPDAALASSLAEPAGCA